jgi:hypothetical protein
MIGNKRNINAVRRELKSWSRILEKFVVAQPAKILPTFKEPRVFFTVLEIPPLDLFLI